MSMIERSQIAGCPRPVAYKAPQWAKPEPGETR